MRTPFLTEDQWRQLLANGTARANTPEADLRPVVCLDAPRSIKRWLLSSVDPDNPDRAMGLIDEGTGMPEIGEVSLAYLSAYRGRTGAPIEADPSFICQHPLSKYRAWARMIGWILV